MQVRGQREFVRGRALGRAPFLQTASVPEEEFSRERETRAGERK